MSDRELLEKAAQAFWAGEVEDMSIRWDDAEQCILYIHGDNQDHNGVDREFRWDPLNDDGDALRLAVQIGPLEFSISEYGTAVRKPKGQWIGCEAHLHGGKQSATRRAIVRAAASLATERAAQGAQEGSGG